MAPAGLVDYHSESVAVIDLSMWLGLNNSEAYHLNTPIVICSGRGVQIAFIASEVLQVETIQPSAIHLQELFNEGTHLLRLSLKLSSGIVLLLNMPY